MIDPAELIYERLLVVRAQAGDEAAFVEVVERYSPRLRYFLRKLTGSTEIEDVLQDVWLDAFRHLGRLAEPQALRAWLYRIARDHALRRLRTSRRIDRSPEAVQAIEAAIDETPANGNEFTPEDAAQIHAALDRLPDEQREILVLRFLEEMSYDEIARVVGCQLGTVRSRLHYAKQALRRELDNLRD